MANFAAEQRKVQQQLAELEAWEKEANAKIKVAYETYEATAEPLREAVEQVFLRGVFFFVSRYWFFP